MVQLFSERGFGFTYASGRYEEYSSVRAVVYAAGSKVFSVLWADGEWVEKETDCYFSVQALDTGSIIEF